jgi:hypothetical protein
MSAVVAEEDAKPEPDKVKETEGSTTFSGPNVPLFTNWKVMTEAAVPFAPALA